MLYQRLMRNKLSGVCAGRLEAVGPLQKDYFKNLWGKKCVTYQRLGA